MQTRIKISKAQETEVRNWRGLALPLILSMAMSTALFTPTKAASQSGQGTFTGEIMDNLCAKDRTHAKMMEQMKSMGNDPATCSKKCVQIGAKYVLYDHDNNAVYTLADQDQAQPFAGQKVRIEGTLDKKKIKIAKIEPAGN